MAQIPKYMVTLPPGAPIATIGFVRAGQVFTAPDEAYVPSLSFVPVNAEAKGALEKAYDAEKKRIEALVVEAKEEDRKPEVRALQKRLKELDAEREKRTTVLELAPEQPKVEEGLTLKQLGEMSGALPQRDGKQDQKPAPTVQHGGKGDRKL